MTMVAEVTAGEHSSTVGYVTRTDGTFARITPLTGDPLVSLEVPRDRLRVLTDSEHMAIVRQDAVLSKRMAESYQTCGVLLRIRKGPKQGDLVQVIDVGEDSAKVAPVGQEFPPHFIVKFDEII